MTNENVLMKSPFHNFQNQIQLKNIKISQGILLDVKKNCLHLYNNKINSLFMKNTTIHINSIRILIIYPNLMLLHNNTYNIA